MESRMRSPITVINGSLGGKAGNTGLILEKLLHELRSQAEVHEVTLKNGYETEALEKVLRSSAGFVFATGTYWDSWGSPLQRFLEDFTETEAGETWLGKPAACLVTMHS